MENKQHLPAVTASRATLPPEVLQKERDYLARRRRASDVSEATPSNRPPIGLAFSGGGMRAAAFHLGVLQALGKSRLLRWVDYWSSVSGGAWVASLFSSLLTAGKLPTGSSASWNEQRRQFQTEQSAPWNQSDILHHLQRRSRLRPRSGEMLSRDWLAALGGAFITTAATVALFLGAALLITGAIFLLGVLLGGVPFWQFLAESDWPGWVDALKYSSPNWASLSVSVLSGFVGATALGFYLMQQPPLEHEATRAERAEHIYRRRATHTYMLGLSGIVLLSELAVRLLMQSEDESIASHPFLLGPSIAMVAATISVWTGSVIHGKRGGSMESPRRARVLLYTLGGASLLLAFAFLAPVVLHHLTWWSSQSLAWWGVAFLSISGLRWAIGEPGVLFDNRHRDGRKAFRSLLIRVMSVVLLFSVLAALAASFLSISVHIPWPGLFLIGAPSLAGVLLLVILHSIVDYNQCSLLGFYRERLDSAFLCTDADQRFQGQQRVRDDRDLTMGELHERHALHSSGAYYEVPNPCPYLLVQCGVRLERGLETPGDVPASDVFTVTRDFCGSAATGYVPTHIYQQGRMRLADFMSLSGLPQDPSQKEVPSLANCDSLASCSTCDVDNGWRIRNDMGTRPSMLPIPGLPRGGAPSRNPAGERTCGLFYCGGSWSEMPMQTRMRFS